MTSELIGKFRSKSDFIKYFSENRKNFPLLKYFLVQLYVPPTNMINKDFLKKILKEEKKLLSLKEVKYVNVPRYDELSVKRFWPILREDNMLIKYMPDFLTEDKIPDRVYFWNVANTV